MGGNRYVVFDKGGEDIVNCEGKLIRVANSYKFNVGKRDGENRVRWRMG